MDDGEFKPHPILNTDYLNGISKALFSTDINGDPSIDFEHPKMIALKSLLKSNVKVTKIDIKILKRYYFLTTFKWFREDELARELPVSVVIPEINTWLDQTFFEYASIYTMNGVYRHCKYSMADFMKLSFVEIDKVLAMCKALSVMEEKAKSELDLDNKDNDVAGNISDVLEGLEDE